MAKEIRKKKTITVGDREFEVAKNAKLMTLNNVTVVADAFEQNGTETAFIMGITGIMFELSSIGHELATIGAELRVLNDREDKRAKKKGKKK